jgi:dephospho-CoA kinase
MNFILIIGPPAVGKMTVGQCLSELSGYKLFHNHQSIDFTLQYYDWGTPEFKSINEGIRQLMFRTAAESKRLKGLIFTLVWAFDEKSDWNYVEELEQKFVENGWKFYIVELYAPLSKRLVRNTSANRLLYKRSKRNLQKSTKNLKSLENSYQMSSKGSLENRSNYLFVDNSDLTPERVSKLIFTHFKLK